MLNVQAILHLAEVVEKSETFWMGTFYNHPCGTPACIYGHLVPEYEANAPGAIGFKAGADKLGLAPLQSVELFAPRHDDCADWTALIGDPGYVTNEHAAACLRKLAATGEVDWKGTKPT